MFIFLSPHPAVVLHVPRPPRSGTLIFFLFVIQRSDRPVFRSDLNPLSGISLNYKRRDTASKLKYNPLLELGKSNQILLVFVVVGRNGEK